MEQGHTPQAPPVPPPVVDPEARPATAGELRTLRRWVVVTGVWAVAATAVALIALLDEGDTGAKNDSAANSRRISQVERALDRRLDDLEGQMEGTAKADDVSKLQERLAKSEDDASQAKSDADKAKEDLADLDDRVTTLEEDSGGSSPDQSNQP